MLVFFELGVEQTRLAPTSRGQPDSPQYWDGQCTFTDDRPPVLLYYLRLPFETYMDAIRIQSDRPLNLLRVFIEQPERSSLSEKYTVRSTSRLCRLPAGYAYDYHHLRIRFLQATLIRIEVPTFGEYR